VVCVPWAAHAAEPARLFPARQRLAEYRAELAALRAECGGAHALPDVNFFLFGMGARPKLLYKAGALMASPGGELLRQWQVRSETIVPPDYRVSLTTDQGVAVEIVEDEQAVWIEEGGRRVALAGTQSPVHLLTMAGRRYAQVLRVLQQEVLINVIAGKPVPNYFVYPKPWYRDGAMMALCLKATGNLDLIRAWVLGLDSPYDHNAHGESEADNLGQALLLISLVSDRSHPLVPKILRELPRWEMQGPAGKYLQGRTDYAAHPAYQTKWAKFGLAALGLPDPYQVPRLSDPYAALFWLAYKQNYVKGKDAHDRGPYPYLGWACDHFHGTKTSPLGNRDYPLTWEQTASDAHYEGMQLVSPEYTKQRLASPHAWHSAEAFLYLLEERRKE
jgi:hypothetical protein